MGLETTRRSLITGLIALVAAPAIVRAGSLMPVKVMPFDWCYAEHYLGKSMYFAKDGHVIMTVSSSQWTDLTRGLAEALVRRDTPSDTPKTGDKWDTLKPPVEQGSLQGFTLI